MGERTYYSNGNREYFPGQGLTELEIIGSEMIGAFALKYAILKAGIYGPLIPVFAY